jgi:hypothetical protein
VVEKKKIKDMDRKEFFKPLRGEYKWNPHGILNLIGALGIIPSIYLGRCVDSIWLSIGAAATWYYMVYFVYLTYHYNK